MLGLDSALQCGEFVYVCPRLSMCMPNLYLGLQFSEWFTPKLDCLVNLCMTAQSSLPLSPYCVCVYIYIYIIYI